MRLLAVPAVASPVQLSPFHSQIAHHAVMQVAVLPSSIDVGRDVVLRVVVRGASGTPLSDAVLNVSGAGLPVLASTKDGQAQLRIHAAVLGVATLAVSHSGYAPAVLRLPIIAGPPAVVVALKRGLSVRAPGAPAQPGRVGLDLLERYHAATAARQFASLGLRDGTLVDLNSQTDVMIRDPLHMTLSKGELFLEIVHGDVQPHVIQVGSAVAATHGTRLDVRLDRATRVTVVTVFDGLVRVSNKGATVSVGAGQQSTIPANASPGAPAPANLSTIAAWLSNLPNTTPAVVPAFATTVLPPAPRIGFPPVAPTATLTITANLERTNWSGVVRLEGAVTIPATSTVTVQLGTVMLTDGSNLTVEGTLLAQGTANAPIIVTSSLPSPHAGVGGAIFIDGPRAGGTRLDYVHDFYSLGSGVSVTGGAQPVISNSAFIASTEQGIYIDDTSAPTIANCVFASNGEYAVSSPVSASGLITGTALGAGQLGILVRDGTTSHATTWHSQNAPFILSFVTVAAGTTLSVEPGVVVEMVKRESSDSTLTIRGVLIARGTAAAPIIFTSAAPQPQPGDWRSIAFTGTGTAGSVLEHALVFYGGSGLLSPGSVVATAGASPSILRSTIAQSGQNGIYSDDVSRPDVLNCTFAGNLLFAASVPAEGAALVSNAAFATGQAGIEIRGNSFGHVLSITRPTIWPYESVPYVLDNGAVTVTASLVIEPGTVIELGELNRFVITGTLLAVGQPDNPIIFTDIPSSGPSAIGGSIVLSGQSASHSAFQYVGFFHGYDQLVSVDGGAAPTIADSLFAQAAGTGIYVDATSHPSITDCVFAGLTRDAIEVPGDAADGVRGTLLGLGQAGIAITGSVITHSTTWHRQDAPFTIAGSETVVAGATLTIEQGTVVAMEHHQSSGGLLWIRGTLLARGTANEPITFTTDAPVPQPGSWEGLFFDGKRASDSRMDHTIIEYGGSVDYVAGMVYIGDGASPAITNSSILNSSSGGIVVSSTSTPTIRGCFFRGLRGYAITIPAADRANVGGNTFAPGQLGIETSS